MNKPSRKKLHRVLNAVKKLREDRKVGRPLPKGSSPWKNREIECTEEFLRISSIERRKWEKKAVELAAAMSPLLALTGGELYPVQAWLLYELWRLGYAIGIVRVGGGKSLVTFLAPRVVQAKRPVLVVPGDLLDKTLRHMREDRYKWKIPDFIRVVSYEWLAHKNNKDFFYTYRPDLVMFDEGSKLKSLDANVTKQVGYYLQDCRRGYTERLEHGRMVKYKLPKGLKPKVLLLSGTLTNDSLNNYAHLLRWILPRQDVPLPLGPGELETWRCCLDVDVGELMRVQPGALLEWCNEKERKIAKRDPIKAGRKAYRRRLLATPGIVSTQKPFLGASLVISGEEVKPPKEIREAFTKLRRKWKTPDGWELQDAQVAAMRARQLALGFYQRPNPKPPDAYVNAYKEWARECRRVLGSNRRRLNSEAQLIDAIEEHGLYPELWDILEDWRYWDNEFKIRNETIWLNDYAVEFAAKWMEDHDRGIVWTRSPSFGRRLSERTGVSYYGSKSLDSNGRSVLEHPHNTPMICSVRANGFGKNLQYGWSQNLFMCAISSGEWYEQVLGRTHRENQPADVVTAQLFLPCIEYLNSFWTAVEKADFAEDMESARKLLYADVTVPTPLEINERRSGPLWEESVLAA